MMRPELFHPMFVHFPIVGITVLWIFKGLGLYQFFIKKNSNWISKDLLISRWILYPSIASYIISLYLGDVAFEAIKSQFSYLFKITHHEELAQKGLIFLVFVSLFEILMHLKSIEKYQKIFFVLQWLLLSIVFYYLFQTAHSGASLVYDYQAGTIRGPL